MTNKKALLAKKTNNILYNLLFLPSKCIMSLGCVILNDK